MPVDSFSGTYYAKQTEQSSTDLSRSPHIVYCLVLKFAATGNEREEKWSTSCKNRESAL